jgi:glycosyltransferase involved in cell wall biosynthesis
MRIALFHDLPSGGAKRAVYECTRKLASSHRIDVYTLSEANHTFCDIRPLVKSHKIFDFTPRRLFKSPWGRLNQLQRWRDLRQLYQLARRIADEIDSKGYDVVFAQPCMWSQAPLVLLHLRTPAVYYCQEPPRAIYESSSRVDKSSAPLRKMLDRVDPLIHLYRSMSRQLDWEATRKARVVLVNSRFMGESVSRIYGLVPQVSYLGVDTDVFRPLPGVKRQDYVLSVGAIAPHKGFDFLISSLARLHTSRRPSLKLVGNVQVEGQCQSLHALAERLQVNMSIEVGIDQETIVRRYNEAALVTYAPHNEPFGLVPLEAMACGTPVVGVAEGGVPETIIDGVTGRLVSRDPNEFARTIEELLCDTGRRKLMGEQGAKHVQESWTWDAAVNRVEQYLMKVTSETDHSVPRRLEVYA